VAFIGIGIAFVLGLLLGHVVVGPTAVLVIAGVPTLALVGNALATRASRSSAEDDVITSGWGAVERELSRARRMERTFSLARLTPTQDVESSSRAGVLRELRRTMRDIDAGWWEDKDVFLLLSETSTAEVGSLIARLEAALPALRFRWSAAEFPRDGLTVPAIIATLATNASAPLVQLEVSDGAA
jgi:hypothetical protein